MGAVSPIGKEEPRKIDLMSKGGAVSYWSLQNNKLVAESEDLSLQGGHAFASRIQGRANNVIGMTTMGLEDIRAKPQAHQFETLWRYWWAQRIVAGQPY